MNNDKMTCPPLAMACMPWQRWEGTLSPADALARGTAFAAWICPFWGRGCAHEL